MSADNEEHAESLGSKLVKALKNSAGSGKREIEVEHEGSTARAKVHGAGPYGSSVDRFTVVGPARERSEEQAGEEVERQAAQIEDKVTYLPERLRQHEIAPGLSKGVLRSHPDELRNREYNEVELRGGGEIDVSRYRYNKKGGGRRRIPQPYSHETLERLADDLADALEPEVSDDR